MADPVQANPRSPYYSDQQWLNLLQMGDLSAQEQQIAAQRALAQQLRGAKDSGRMDWGSQTGRGLQGIAGAMYDYKSMKDAQQLKADKQKWLDTMGQMYRQPQTPQPASTPPAAAYSGFEE